MNINVDLETLLSMSSVPLFQDKVPDAEELNYDDIRALIHRTNLSDTQLVVCLDENLPYKCGSAASINKLVSNIRSDIVEKDGTPFWNHQVLEKLNLPKLQSFFVVNMIDHPDENPTLYCRRRNNRSHIQMRLQEREVILVCFSLFALRTLESNDLYERNDNTPRIDPTTLVHVLLSYRSRSFCSALVNLFTDADITRIGNQISTTQEFAHIYKFLVTANEESHSWVYQILNVW